MQQEERKWHSKCMGRSEILKSHLKFWDAELNNGFQRVVETYFGEEYSTFCQKMHKNLDQLQRPSYDSDMVSKVHHDTFEYVFAHSIQNYVQPESTPDTYMVNENNSNIISDIPNMDPVRDKEEHDYVVDEQ
ncbi:hypothetical protein Tco_0882543 [Tanacetum coccineum]